jgi:hypothetical protein
MPRDLPASDNARVALIVTTINEPNNVMRELAQGCRRAGWTFFVIGDKKGPRAFDCEGAMFYSLEQQAKSGLTFASACPIGHYARKNIGYLLAIANGAEIIVETDDDNMPRGEFWNERRRRLETPVARETGWLNVYAYFADNLIWPRGLPLDAIKLPVRAFETLALEISDCPIQQGLADDNPDVDAIYRLIGELPIRFRRDRRIALAQEVWCPFNSQNTTWWSDAFPLLYLPAYCSFRMTDIWRSLVAQRIAWSCGWSVLFHEPTVHQDRNVHNLMSDFSDEVPGYLYNRAIAEGLLNLSLKRGAGYIAENILLCYEFLVKTTRVAREELPLLERWLADIQHATRIGRPR